MNADKHQTGRKAEIGIRISANLDYQKTHFKDIYDSYEGAQDLKSLQEVGTGIETEAEAWKEPERRIRDPWNTGKYLYIVCRPEELPEIAAGVFGVQFGERIKAVRKVDITQGVEERWDYDPDMHLLTAEKGMAVPLRSYKVCISVEIERGYLDTAGAVFVSGKLKEYQKRKLQPYGGYQFSTSGELKNKLEAFLICEERKKISGRIETAAPKKEEKAFTEAVKRSVVPGESGENLYQASVSLKAAVKIFKAGNTGRIEDEVTKEMLNAYRRAAESVLAGYLKKGRFTENFGYVEIYLKQEAETRNCFRRFIRGELIPEYESMRKGEQELSCEYFNRITGLKSVEEIDMVILRQFSIWEKKAKALFQR